MTQDREPTRPLCLIIPGSEAVRRGHWQDCWLRHRDDCALADLGSGIPPLRNIWLSRIDQAVSAAGRPVILAGEGLGALAIVWWAALLGKAAARRVRGAALIFPSDPEQPGGDAEDFAPLPKAMLPFPSIVVAAADHRSVTVDRHREMAAHWLSDFVTVHHERSFSQSHWHGGEQLLELLQAGGPGLSRYTYRAEPVIQPTARQSSSRLPARRSA